MDVFAQIENRVAAALEALQAEGALPADVPTSGIEVETPRDPRTAIWRPTPRWCWPSRRT